MEINSFAGLLEFLREAKHEQREQVTEAIVIDLISQLDLIDPCDEADSFLGLLSEYQESATPLLEFLFGVPNLDEYAQDLFEEYLEEDE